MNKKFLSKTFAIVLAISFVLSNSAMLVPQKAGAVDPLFYSSMEAPTFGPTYWSEWETEWSQIASDKKCDNKSARIKDDTGINPDYITTVGIDTNGYQSLTLNFWYKIPEKLESTDYIKVQWSGDGSNWDTNTIHTYSNITVGSWTYASLSLPAGAESKSNLKIRFLANLRDDDVRKCGSVGYPTCDSGDEFLLDCVELTGEASPECTVDANCDDGLYCNGAEICVSGYCQPSTLVDCSGNNIIGINECYYTPDDVDCTKDYRVAFTSVCNEDTDSCTIGSDTISHTCSVVDCRAECDAQHLCADTECDNQNGCVGNDHYTYTDVANSCRQGDCSCTNKECGAPIISYNDPACTKCQKNDDCNSFDRDYCDGTVIKHDEGLCINYECVADTRIMRDCDNGLTCDGAETCSDANCVGGIAVNCSSNDLPKIDICTYIPDSVSCTLDFRAAFTSVCHEPEGACTTGDETITHTCNISICGAECESDSDCDDRDPNTTDRCNLDDCSCSYITNPYCGDGQCNDDETCEICPEDCGQCPVEQNCGNDTREGDEQCDGTDGVISGENFCTINCELIPIYDGQHSCPAGTVRSENPILGPTQISATGSDGENINVGIGKFLLEVTGTFKPNQTEDTVSDAGYTTVDNWNNLATQYGIHGSGNDYAAHALLSDFGNTDEVGVVDWGQYNPDHIYTKYYESSTDWTRFVIGDRYSNWFDTKWDEQAGMNDNEGSLTLNIYTCDQITPQETGSLTICKYRDYDPYGGQKGEEDTPEESWEMRVYNDGDYDQFHYTGGDGCVTISDLEFGSYTVVEDLPDGWSQMYPSNGTGNQSHPVLLDKDHLSESVYFLNYNETDQIPTMYACNPTTLQCAIDGSGQFGSLQGCKDACGARAPLGGQYVYSGVVAGEATVRGEEGRGGEEGIVAGASCVPYLYEYIKYGANNNPFEVKKLQAFLNGYLGLNLDVNGVYNSETYEAVKRFQYMLKHDILSPWVENGCLPSEELPTGYVYRTTKWAINNIFCPTPRPDVSDEKCYYGETIGLAENGSVLGESVALAEEGALPEEETPPEEEETPVGSTETTETTISEEETTGGASSQTVFIALLSILVLGGIAYFVFRGKKA